MWCKIGYKSCSNKKWMKNCLLLSHPKVHCHLQAIKWGHRWLFGHILRWFFFNHFFFQKSGLHILQAFHQHQKNPIPILYEFMMHFHFRWVVISFFMYSLRSPICNHMPKLPKDWRTQCQKWSSFAYRIHSFSILLMVLCDVIFNVATYSWIKKI
jgi:hypothetical protein